MNLDQEFAQVELRGGVFQDDADITHGLKCGMSYDNPGKTYNFVKFSGM